MIRPRACTLSLAIAGLATVAMADPLTVSGPARVLDGDTVIVGTTHVRLKGVDAAERGTERGEDARAVMMGIVTSDLYLPPDWRENPSPRSRLLLHGRRRRHQPRDHRERRGAGLPAL